MKIVAITAGIGIPSTARLLSDAVGNAVMQKLASQDEMSSFVVHELREHASGIMNAMTGGFANPELQKVIDDVEEADLLIAVTPVYKASMSGLFKSFFDILDENLLEGKTVILGATGGTHRHSLVLDYSMRPLFAYMRANILSTSIFVSPGEWGDSYFTQRVETIANEVLNNGTPIVRRKEQAMVSANFEDMLAAIKS